jgi:DNA polymerase-3 subunit epsilon
VLITGLDTETTGLEQAEGHRIIEIALLTYDAASRKLVDRYVQRIDPERAISAKAQEVHGISYSELVGMPKWEAVAPEVVARLQKTDLAVAHNMDFDGPFIGGELLRVGQPIPNMDLFCTMQNGRWACADGKLPKLMELCFALGVEYDQAKAHAADYDVMVMMDCLWRALDRGFYQLPYPTSAFKAAA